MSFGFRLVSIFAFGIFVGFATTSLFRSYNTVQEVHVNYEARAPVTCPPQQKQPPAKQLHYNMDLNASYARELLHKVEEMHSRRLAHEIRILCWVLTNPANHKEKAYHVKTTWGRHCNKLIFISDEEDSELPAVKPDGVLPGREGLWSKTYGAFKYVHENYRDEYDWVMKADDDTYVFVENLRLMLLPYSSGEPLQFGLHFIPNVPRGFMSGGAGYALSKEAVDRLVAQLNKEPNENCLSQSNSGAEDKSIAFCLRSVGVEPGDSRDSKGRHRFYPFQPQLHASPDFQPEDWWFWKFLWWPMYSGSPDSCSDEPVSFHYVKPAEMYMIEYLAYRVKPYGVVNLERATPPPTTPVTHTT